MKINSNLNPVIVLDLRYAGYGILKSLYKYGIPLYGFTYSESHIELKTRYTQKSFVYNSLDELKHQLIELSQSSSLKPVLMLTNDEKVEFVLEHLEELKRHLIINITEPNITYTLIDKIRLRDITKKLNIKVPKTVNIECIEDGLSVKNLVFPVIVKPFLKSNKWYEAGFPKAIIFDKYTVFEKQFEKMFAAEPRIIVQEFIPGGDDNIFYCLTYYNNQGECKCHFTGQKIRQWHVLTGSTASTKPVVNDFVTNETLRIFNAIKFKGFGSIEYKKHELTGEFYMIEPTAGRINLQEYIATCTGNNIPLKAYCDMTGIEIEPIEKEKKNIVYIEELAELSSFCEYNAKWNLSVYNWIKSIKGKRYYRLLDVFDYKIGLTIFLIISKKLSVYFLKKTLKTIRTFHII
jgi:predicted ATP-grasp superfamily ATP-dependent carboligase